MVFVICAAFVLMCLFFLAFQRLKAVPGHSRALEIAVKCAATAMPVAVALLGCLRNGIPGHWVLLAGLVVCMVADGVLCIHFLAGGVIFALGHVLYMTAFCLMRRPDWHSLIVFLCLMGLAALGLIRFRSRIGNQYRLLLIYAAVLSMMVAMASVQAPLYFAGAVLFAVSDSLLVYLMFGQKHAFIDYISLGAYYLGQFLLGLGNF